MTGGHASTAIGLLVDTAATFYHVLNITYITECYKWRQTSGQIYWKVFKYKYFSSDKIQIRSDVNVLKYKYFQKHFKYKYFSSD